MKTKYYWKVVKKTYNPNIWASSLITGKYSLEYQIGMITKSAMDENGIFVFKTRDRARKYKKNYSNFPGFTILKVLPVGREISENKIKFYDYRELRSGVKVPTSSIYIPPRNDFF